MVVPWLCRLPLSQAGRTAAGDNARLTCPAPYETAINNAAVSLIEMRGEKRTRIF
jgi:hypothetical protein